MLRAVGCDLGDVSCTRAGSVSSDSEALRHEKRRRAETDGAKHCQCRGKLEAALRRRHAGTRLIRTAAQPDLWTPPDFSLRHRFHMNKQTNKQNYHMNIYPTRDTKG